MKVEPFDTKRHLLFSRRTTILSGGLLAMFGGIGFRLFDLQVRRHDEFAAKAEDNRFKNRVVVPPRGEIVDRNGLLLAGNQKNFRVLVTPGETEDLMRTVAELDQIIGLTPEDRDRLLERIASRRQQPFVPIQVTENLSWDAYAALNYELPRLQGVSSEIGQTRYYPPGDPVAPFVGHVGAADARDLERAEGETERLLYLQPGFKLGKLGLEMTEDKVLKGKPGTRMVEVTAAGRVVDESTNRGTAAEPGATLGLTIDLDLQEKATEILGTDYEEYPAGTEMPGFSGAAVVIDVVTGDILVLASTPTFDPNAFARNIDTQTLQGLRESEMTPMIPKPIAGTYPPGSTFKVVSAVAAMEAGIPPSTRFFCSGGFWYGGRRFNCWKRAGHGGVGMAESLKVSCDVYYYNLATRLDIDHLAETARKFGLGQRYDLGLPAEAQGIVPDREWKRVRYRTDPANQTWFPGETLSTIIGQGAVTATPLQLAVMSARVATGREVVPRLVRSVADRERPVKTFPHMSISDESLAVARDGMNQVVNEWGTAARSSLKPEYLMAGKTGTSQVRSLQINPRTGRPYSNHELPWNRRDHALFVAFAPYENPRYACCVVAEHGGSGSRAAGPRARDIMKAVLDKDPANPEKNPLYVPGAPAKEREEIKTAQIAGQGSVP